MSGHTNTEKPAWMRFAQSDFFTAATATSTSCLFSNPFEVVKTRLQLQGELAGKDARRIYKGPIHALRLIIAKEGITAIQKGLSSAILYQIAMNGTRLGSYSHFKTILGVDPKSKYFFPKNLLAGASAGMLGACLASPLYLVKVRMQSQSSAFAIGHQHHYRGNLHALSDVIKTEGFFGLWRGVDGAMLRVSIGSAVQLSTYDYCKYLILLPGIIKESVAVHLAASLASSVLVVLAMNPCDVVSTRLYNQPVKNGKGLLYTGPFNCLWKTVKSEGVKGLYKGTVSQYLRLGPHTVLTFVFLGASKKNFS